MSTIVGVWTRSFWNPFSISTWQEIGVNAVIVVTVTHACMKTTYISP